MASVTIKFLGETAAKLNDAGSLLYAFKAVRCSNKSGLPLVWFATSRLMATTVVSWTSATRGYVSASSVQPNTLIVPGFEEELPPGSTLKITSASGNGTVTGVGTPGVCSIDNTTQTEFSCGLEQTPAGAAKPLPLCAFTLFGGNVATITPLEKVLLIFSTLPIAAGTAVTSVNVVAPINDLAMSTSGLMVDLTGVDQRAVQYDINSGWNWGNATWGKGVPQSANLAEWLILPDVTPAKTASLALIL